MSSQKGEQVSLEEYSIYKPVIEKRLLEFKRLPKSRWFREVAFCLFTPQSSPFHAEGALIELEEAGGLEGKLSDNEVANILGKRHRYVRFHVQKAKRFNLLVKNRSKIEKVIFSRLSPINERARLIELVNGMGLKEGSHALRNIGRTGLAILDRHILRCLCEQGVIKEVPKSLTTSGYLEIEGRFREFSKKIQISMDGLDFFFWLKATGLIFK
jgi:N-glycosylase/DNA lyase